MNKTSLIDQLKQKINTILPILKKNNVAQTHTEIFSSYNPENGTFVRILTNEENKLFTEILDIILKQDDIADKYAEEFVKNRLVILYHKLLKNESALNAEIENTVEYLLETPVQEYLVFSNLENIRIIDNLPYNLAESQIKLFKEEISQDELTKQIVAELLNKPAIFTKVRAAEPEKAKELALYNFTISLNLLRLYAPSFKPVLTGNLLSGNRSLYVFNETLKQLSVGHSVVGDLPLNTAYLSEDLYKKLVEAGIEDLGGNSSNSSISKAVKEGVYWFGLGLEEKHPSAKLVNFVTVLEAVLKKDGERTELARAISERGAILLCDDLDSRTKVCNDLKRIYDLRSSVIHSGVLLDDRNTTLLAGGYARAVLISIVQSNKRFKGKHDDLIKKLDELKLTGKRFME